MKALPHFYSVRAAAGTEGNLRVTTEGLSDLAIAAPADYDGPGDHWSPEQLLMASVSSCLILSFRALAKLSNLQWQAIECNSSGELDKVDRRVRFTRIQTRARLTIAAGESRDRAESLLNKAKDICFISNSLTAASQFSTLVIVAGE